MKKYYLRQWLPVALMASLLSAAPLIPAYGQWQWASNTATTPLGTNDFSRAEQSATDAAGNVYVTGMFKGTVTFGAAGTLVSTGNTADIFVAKLDGASGNWLWVAQGAGAGDDTGYGIAVDGANNVYVTGRFDTPSVQFTPLAPLVGSGGFDVFVVQLNATTGVPIANVAGGGALHDVGYSLAYDAGANSLYVTGEYQSGTATFGAPITNVAAGTADVFVAQLTGGALAWAGPTASVGGPDDDAARGVAVNPAGEVFITGSYASAFITFGGNAPLLNAGGVGVGGTPNSDIFVAKSTAALGAWVWSKTAGGLGRDIGQDVAINTTGQVLATGSFEPAPAAFGSIVFAAAATGTDVYVARLHPGVGTWQWVRQGGGTTDDAGLSIDHDAAGSIYVTGAFRSSTATFGATVLTNFTASGTNDDVFVSKLTNAGAWTWTRQAGGVSDETGRGLSVSNSSGVFVCGDYSSTPAVFAPFPLTPGLFTEAFVARLPGALPNLTISTPTLVPAGGAYHNIVVLGPNGVATLTGPVYAGGNVVVKNGGTWQSNCFPLTGPAGFNLNAGGLIVVCSPQGIALTGPTGDIQVTGPRTFNTSADYTYMNPPGGPQITGTGLSGARDLRIQTPVAGVAVSQPAFVRRLLEFLPGSGNLVLTNQLRLLSTSMQTAMIINSSPLIGAVLPNGVHERFIDGTFTTPNIGYRLISSPMTTSVIADLTTTTPAFTPVVNSAYNGCAPYLGPLPNVYGYDETIGGGGPTFACGLNSPPSLLSALAPGYAVSAYMTDNCKPAFRGTFQNGNVSVTNLTQTGGFLGAGQQSGWHLLGNPYPSPLDWNSATIPSGMQPTIWYWRSTGGATGSYFSFTAGGGPGQNLAIGQGFYARVNVTVPVFTFTNALRPTAFTNVPYYSRPVASTHPQAHLTLRATTDAAEFADALRFSFAPGAALAATDRGDSERPGRNVGHATLLSLTPDGVELSLNSLPETTLQTGTTVELLLDLPTAGTYDLTAAHLVNMTGSAVQLLDRLTQTYYDLTTQPTVLFTAPAGEARNRFALVVGARVTGVAAEAASAALSLTPNPAHGTVQVLLPPDETQRVTLLDATGRVVRQTIGRGPTALDLTHLSAGVYVVRAGTTTRRLVVE